MGAYEIKFLNLIVFRITLHSRLKFTLSIYRKTSIYITVLQINYANLQVENVLLTRVTVYFSNFSSYT